VCGVGFMGCQPKTKQVSQMAEQVEQSAPEQISCLEAIEQYFVTQIGSQYSHGDFCIPCITIVATDESNTEDVKVWGDYWVYNYNLAGDTLKTVSGGSHPGLIHLKKSVQGYEVTAFDVVEDGSRYLPSAKRIFGEWYDDFHAQNSDDNKRRTERLKAINEYVKQHGMKVNYYQDFGWPAVALNH